MVMEMKFIINKYSQVFYRVSPAYGRLANFIIVDWYVGFPEEGYNSSFADSVVVKALCYKPKGHGFDTR
jgi:hypothetical protein